MCRKQTNRRSKNKRGFYSVTKSHCSLKGTQEEQAEPQHKETCSAICWKRSDGKCLLQWLDPVQLGAQQEGEWTLQTRGPPGDDWSREHERQWPQKVQPGARETRKAPGRSPSRGGREGSPERNKGLRRNEPGLLLKLRRTEEGEVISNEHCKRGGGEVQDASHRLAGLVINTLGKDRCPQLRTKQGNDYLESKRPRISAWNFTLNKKFLL